MSEAQVLKTSNNPYVFKKICQSSAGKSCKCWLSGKWRVNRFCPYHICVRKKIYDIFLLNEKIIDGKSFVKKINKLLNYRGSESNNDYVTNIHKEIDEITIVVKDKE